VGLEDALENAKWDINSKLLMYESGFEGGWLPSTVYRYDSMLMALQIMYLEGVGDLKFYVGEDVAGVEGVKIGLVNLAAFLAQSIKETIKYNAWYDRINCFLVYFFACLGSRYTLKTILFDVFIFLDFSVTRTTGT
jgi:hypothetical protein